MPISRNALGPTAATRVGALRPKAVAPRSIALTIVGIVAFVSIGTAAAASVTADDLGAILHTQGLLTAGFQGQDVRVGVISGGASSYDALVQRQVLPAGISFFGRSLDDDDEGDWMMQVVHQIAPRAQLGFCATESEPETVNCARQLVINFHADIVVDDVNREPVYDAPTRKVIGLQDLLAGHPNVLFFTGAGNNGGGYYEARWTPTPLTADGVSYAAQDFGSSMGQSTDVYESFEAPPHSAVTVQLGTDLKPAPEGIDEANSTCASTNPTVTLALVDSGGNVLDSTHGQCPVMRLRYQNTDVTFKQVRVVVLMPVSAFAPLTKLKLIAFRGGDGVSPIALKYRTGGGAGNSATAPGLFSVAAVDPNTAWGGRYLYESFANAGPQCLDYSATSDGNWSRLPTPLCVKQPAFVTPDRATVLMPGPEGLREEPFVGDSSAGPAAAGVAALLLSAKVSAQQIAALLERTATPQISASGWSPHYGYGLIDADAAAVSAGILPRARENNGTSGLTDDPPPFRPGPQFLRDRMLSDRAQHGDETSAASLTTEAQAGQVDAETWLAFYDHAVGDNAAAARWALAAANSGEPVAQRFLGTLFNRGWGVPVDPRAAQAWWWRAARVGDVNSIFNMGSLLGAGRGAPADPVVGYALMRAAMIRGIQNPDLASWTAEAQAKLEPQQAQVAEKLAIQFANHPASIPMP